MNECEKCCNCREKEYYADFRVFIEERFKKIKPEKLSEEFSDKSQEVEKYIEELKTLLPEQQHEQVQRLDSAIGELLSASDTVYFRHGFYDGVDLFLSVTSSSHSQKQHIRQHRMDFPPSL